MNKKVKYTCKNCGWETSIRAEWSDIRPKRCMNKKCNTSFLANPKDLKIDRPIKEVKISDEGENEKSNSKSKSSSKSFKQQSKEKDSN